MVDARMADDTPVRVEDLVPVRSRVSWAAIFAGAVVALATFLVLSLLGASIGLSVADDVRGDNLATGGAVWAIVSTIAALFVGGWLTSQLTVGENRREAAVHGVVMWGVTLALIVSLAGMGVRVGFGAMVGLASVAERTADRAVAPGESPEDAARRLGFTQQQIDDAKRQAQATAADARAAANDPATREDARRRTATAAWWTLFGVMLSMATAVVGALVGAGPTFRLFGVAGVRTTARTSRLEIAHS